MKEARNTPLAQLCLWIRACSQATLNITHIPLLVGVCKRASSSIDVVLPTPLTSLFPVGEGAPVDQRPFILYEPRADYFLQEQQGAGQCHFSHICYYHILHFHLLTFPVVLWGTLYEIWIIILILEAWMKFLKNIINIMHTIHQESFTSQTLVVSGYLAWNISPVFFSACSSCCLLLVCTNQKLVTHGWLKIKQRASET